MNIAHVPLKAKNVKSKSGTNHSFFSRMYLRKTEMKSFSKALIQKLLFSDVVLDFLFSAISNKVESIKNTILI